MCTVVYDTESENGGSENHKGAVRRTVVATGENPRSHRAGVLRLDLHSRVRWTTHAHPHKPTLLPRHQAPQRLPLSMHHAKHHLISRIYFRINPRLHPQQPQLLLLLLPPPPARPRMPLIFSPNLTTLLLLYTKTLPQRNKLPPLRLLPLTNSKLSILRCSDPVALVALVALVAVLLQLPVPLVLLLPVRIILLLLPP